MANFKFDVDADGIALITWDMPGKSMNVIDFALVDEVEALVEKVARSEEHTSELQSQSNLVCRLLLEKKNRSRYFIAAISASFFGILRTQIGARVQFSSTVRCGNRLKLWNTMPTSRRTSSTRRKFGPNSMPSTTISPS